MTPFEVSAISGEDKEKHPHFHVHFTPTSASWLNRVERFFRSISTDRLERSVRELIVAIEEYIAAHHQESQALRLDRRQGQ